MNHFIVHHRFHDNISCLIETLQQHGFNIRLYVILKKKTESYDLAEPNITRESSLSFLTKKIFRKELLQYMPSIRAVYKEYKTYKPEYVLLRPFVSGMGLVHFFMALLFCKRIVLYSQSPKYRKSNFKNDLFLRLVLAIPKTQWMTPVEYREEEIFVQKHSPHKKINYIQLPHHKTDIEKGWFKGDLVNILLIAKFESYKNHRVLIEGLRGIDKQRYKLWIAGDYSDKDDYTLKVLNHLDEADLHYELLGYVDHSNIASLYEKSDLLVLPSSYEMHGYVVNESIAHRVPVVISSKTGTRCLVQEDENGYIFESDNEEHLKEIFESILNDRDELKKLSTGCREVFDQYLSPDTFLKSYLKMLGKRDI